MTEAEQAELAALRELEKAVRADHRDGVIYVPDSQDPKVNRDVDQRWEFIEGVLDTLDRLRDREGRPVPPHHTAAPGSPR
ncbi:MAG: hypothetical protein M3461_04385 [Pseudomonadota bacterium]|nr:hypothetical protein [Pseudomonadota bacterium]